MMTSRQGPYVRGYAALLVTAVILAGSSMVPQPAFAKMTQIGEDMGKCKQKFTGGDSFKNKMCACKDSDCAQIMGSYQVVWTRPTAPSDDSAASSAHQAN